jgi:hypothetical protein
MTTKKSLPITTYTPTDLKTLVDALNNAPTYLSRRFILNIFVVGMMK